MVDSIKYSQSPLFEFITLLLLLLLLLLPGASLLKVSLHTPPALASGPPSPNLKHRQLYVSHACHATHPTIAIAIAIAIVIALVGTAKPYFCSMFVFLWNLFDILHIRSNSLGLCVNVCGGGGSAHIFQNMCSLYWRKRQSLILRQTISLKIH